VRPLITQNSGPTGSPDAPAPRAPGVRSPGRPCRLAPVAALAAAHEDRPPARVGVELGEIERLLDTQAGGPLHDEQPSGPQPVPPSPQHRMTAMISSVRVGRRNSAGPCRAAAARRDNPGQRQVSDGDPTHPAVLRQTPRPAPSSMPTRRSSPITRESRNRPAGAANRAPLIGHSVAHLAGVARERKHTRPRSRSTPRTCRTSRTPEP
jgi:hypothetical protein